MSIPQNPQEYLTLLLNTSRRGGFPAVEGGYGYCSYRTASGQKCAIGLLIPDEETSKGIPNSCGILVNKWAQKFLPSWLTLNDAIQIQVSHDQQQHMGPWNHDKFAADLKTISVFANCNFEEAN